MAIKMAKTATMTAGSSGSPSSSGPGMWLDRIKSFYTDVRMEMKKVTTPSLKEVRSTTLVVVIAVFFFGLYFWVVDNAIGRLLDGAFKYFHR